MLEEIAEIATSDRCFDLSFANAFEGIVGVENQEPWSRHRTEQSMSTSRRFAHQNSRMAVALASPLCYAPASLLGTTTD
jgi:hypothetical protein